MNNKRLKAITDIFDQDFVIDVGSDHGYLPIYLVKKQKVSKALIIEVNDGPLENAKRNIATTGLREQISAIKSNGLQQVDLTTCIGSGIVVAGMGGSLIKTIIENDLDKFSQAKLFLQPNNNEYTLRKYLCENGFTITNDFLVEDDIIYTVIVAQKLDVNPTFSEVELEFGFMPNKNDLFMKKWQDELAHFKKINQQLLKSGNDNAKIDNQIKKITKILGE